MKRILLFVLTNVAVLAVISVVFKLLGLESYFDEQGGLNLTALLIMSAIIGFAGSLISLAMSKAAAKRMMGLKVIEKPANRTETWLVETVRRQAEAAGIGMPEVAVFDSPQPNAFATGARRDAALVAVSTGLLQQMQADEVEAVLGHEVSHVANGDMVTMALMQGVVNTFVVFLSRVIGVVVDRVVFKVERGHGPAFFLVSLVAQVLLGILATMIVMWFSRHREFHADAGGARLAGREEMIRALQRLGGPAADDLPDQLAAFGITGRFASGIKRLFLSHPPIPERIAALRAAR
ncbi:MAG: protease HtpX [Chromatiales bacterium]|nr:protease HtpX [Chromatiales bacterium]